MRLTTDESCFVCGPENESGLRVRFECGEGRSRAEFTPAEAHQGYAALTHGGILAALLDEAMVYAAVSLGGWVATAEMTVRYRRPAAVGAPLTVTAHVTRDTLRLVECAADIRDAAGTLIARATGKMLRERGAKGEG